MKGQEVEEENKAKMGLKRANESGWPNGTVLVKIKDVFMFKKSEKK